MMKRVPERGWLQILLWAWDRGNVEFTVRDVVSYLKRKPPRHDLPDREYEKQVRIASATLLQMVERGLLEVVSRGTPGGTGDPNVYRAMSQSNFVRELGKIALR